MNVDLLFLLSLEKLHKEINQSRLIHYEIDGS